MRSNPGNLSDVSGLLPTSLCGVFLIYEAQMEYWCCDGSEILEEVTKREKQAGIRPEADVDTYMKVSYGLQLELNLLIWTLVTKTVSYSRKLCKFWWWLKVVGFKTFLSEKENSIVWILIRFASWVIKSLAFSNGVDTILQATALPGAKGSLAVEYNLKVNFLTVLLSVLCRF